MCIIPFLHCCFITPKPPLATAPINNKKNDVESINVYFHQIIMRCISISLDITGYNLWYHLLCHYIKLVFYTICLMMHQELLTDVRLIHLRRGKTLKLFLEYWVCNTAFLNTKKKIKEVQLINNWIISNMTWEWHALSLGKTNGTNILQESGKVTKIPLINLHDTWSLCWFGQ